MSYAYFADFALFANFATSIAASAGTLNFHLWDIGSSRKPERNSN